MQLETTDERDAAQPRLEGLMIEDGGLQVSGRGHAKG